MLSKFHLTAPVAQRLAHRAYNRTTTFMLMSRSCEERDGRGFNPLLEHIFLFLLTIFFIKKYPCPSANKPDQLFEKKAVKYLVYVIRIDLKLKPAIGDSSRFVYAFKNQHP